jgi:hypothetical protein
MVFILVNKAGNIRIPVEHRSKPHARAKGTYQFKCSDILVPVMIL